MTPDKSSPAGQDPSTSARGVARACQDPRLWWFRLFALALPLLVIAAAELVLRIAGYGYPTSFFLERQQDEAKILVENPKFGWRFFPPAVARSPQPLSFSVQKPLGTIRIFLFGESAAMGDPEPSYGFGRQLQRMLQARHPNLHFELVNVAMTAINSHVMRAIAADCAGRQGDVWLIYAGNNEVIGPFGAGTVFGARAASLWSARAVLLAKSFKIGQLLTSVKSDRAPHQWQGMELFLHNQVSAQDPRLATVYKNFSANLDAVIQSGMRSGAKIVLGTVAVNLKDNPPFGSAHRPDLATADQKQWSEQFEQAKRAEISRQYSEALAAYQQSLRLDPDYAQAVFGRARCELALGETNSALADFSLARDLDVLRFRADSRLNEMIRRAARPGVGLVDIERELARNLKDQLPGDDQFYDHVHLNFSGNYKVARLLAEQVERQLFPSTPLSGTWLSEAEVAHQLAFTEFDRRRVGEEMRLRLQQPPFSKQSNFEERDRQWQRFLSAPQAAPADLTWEYRAALALAPGDWMLRGNFGRLFEAAGDRAAAAEQWAQVAQQLPGEPEAHFHLANLAYDAGKYDQSVAEFQRALALSPSSLEALSGLGLALAARGQTNEALAQFHTALAIDAGYSAARVNRAVLLAQSGDVSGAVSEYETVLRLDTNNIAARINLAKILFRQGKANDAIALYNQAIQLRPDNAIAHYDLGNALSAQGRHEEALAHYASAVASQPSFADAQFNLALEQSRFGKISEALPHFAMAAALRPSAAEVHFNYGVALAKVQRFSEAVQQFQETLKLQPNYPGAGTMLNRAQQLSSGPLLP